MVVLKILVALIVFGLLIFSHELGHFLMAKACKVRVNEFALGMGPKLVSFGKKETTYSLRLLPIGGFCAMEGEDEDSNDPKAFGNKKVWQRMLIVVAGVVMNFLVGFLVLLIGIGFFNPLTEGESLFGTTTIAGHIEIQPKSYHSGLRPGDTILSINGQAVTTEEEILRSLYEDEDGVMPMEVERPVLALGAVAFDMAEQDGVMRAVCDFALSGTTVASHNTETAKSYESGLRAGDTILSINGQTVTTEEDILRGLQDDEDGVVSMEVKRPVLCLDAVAFETVERDDAVRAVCDFALSGTTVASHKSEESKSYQTGLRVGDTILSINGQAVTTEEEILRCLHEDEDGVMPMEVTRTADGVEQTVLLSDVSFETVRVMRAVCDFELSGTTVAKHNTEMPKSYQTGLRAGDTILSINGRPVITSNDIMVHLQSDEDGVVPMEVRRTVDGVEQTVWLPDVAFEIIEMDGVRQLVYDFQIVGEEQTFWNTFSHAAKTEVSLVTTTWSSLFDMVTGRYGLNDLTGPVGTVDLVGNMVSDAVTSVQREDFYNVFILIALISVNLGVMNLLPIPALDGGRLLFLIIEAVIRRPIPKKFEGIVHLVGFALLILFMIVITFNDIVRLCNQ